MNVKTKENTRLNGITSARACIMVASNLAGLEKKEVDMISSDANLDELNENTFNMNRRKIENHLKALSENKITVMEFQEMLRGEIDRSSTSFATINP